MSITIKDIENVIKKLEYEANMASLVDSRNSRKTIYEEYGRAQGLKEAIKIIKFDLLLKANDYKREAKV